MEASAEVGVLRCHEAGAKRGRDVDGNAGGKNTGGNKAGKKVQNEASDTVIGMTMEDNAVVLTISVEARAGRGKKLFVGA